MAVHGEPAYFEEARAAGRIVVKDPPKFDLDAYIANYKGPTRIHRLYHIGTTSSYLYLEALKAAVAEAKKGKDVKLYEKVASTMYSILPEDPEAVLDTAWIQKTSDEVKYLTDRLESELKGYKNNLIKESIRMGFDDLGRHYHRIGDLANAVKSYSKERDYCQTPSHLAIMSFHLIHVFIDQHNWLNVQSSVQKLRNSLAKPADVDRAQAKMSAAMGVAQLASGNFKDAAISFLSTDPRMLQAKLDDRADDEAYNEILTPNDIAVYGGLCALASMDRDELQSRVLENSSFRNYLELEPHIRRAISFFVSSKYSACLTVLESYRTDYLLDLFLCRHVSQLYFLIRSKAIVQYFIPFSTVTLSALAAAFNTDEPSIEQTLVDMIGNGSLDARIDLEHRVLLARRVDERSEVHEQALEMAKDYERTAQMRILRMEILNAGLEVKAPKAQTLMGMSNMGSLQAGGGSLAGDIVGFEGRPNRNLRSSNKW